MNYTKVHLLRWLKNHKLITITRLEEKCNIPKGTIKHFVSERRDIPNKYIDEIENILGEYGYKKLYSE